MEWGTIHENSLPGSAVSVIITCWRASVGVRLEHLFTLAQWT
jgi:hypothetical protein